MIISSNLVFELLTHILLEDLKNIAMSKSKREFFKEEIEARTQRIREVYSEFLQSDSDDD